LKRKHVDVMKAETIVPSTTALLIIRVLVEPGSSVPLRAYIRETDDVALGFEHLSTVADVETALGIVREWMERALERGSAEDVLPAPSV
jgi:hypothetical protein